jgi:hypothetical protein
MMKERVRSKQQITYCPAITVDRITIHHTLGRLAVTTLEEPGSLCGIAMRVGYTSTSDTALALYRLKLKIQGQRVYVTLSSFFVVDGGIFLPYEHRLSRQGQDDATMLTREENHATSP